MATMTRQELRAFLQSWFCGCGSPAEAADSLRALLALHPLHSASNHVRFEAVARDEGVRLLLLYTLDRFDLTEHGGGVGGGWLTDKGNAVLAALEREKADNYAALFEPACAHGYAVDTEELLDCPECGPMNQVKP